MAFANREMMEGFQTELTKELKEKLENAKSKEEAKKTLEEAGVELTDEDVNQVAGGEMTHDHRLMPLT